MFPYKISGRNQLGRKLDGRYSIKNNRQHCSPVKFINVNIDELHWTATVSSCHQVLDTFSSRVIVLNVAHWYHCPNIFLKTLMLDKLPKEVLEMVALHLKNQEYHKLRLSCSSPRLNLIQVQSFKIFKNQKIRTSFTTCSLDYLNDEMFMYFVHKELVTEFRRSVRFISKISNYARMEVLWLLKDHIFTKNAAEIWTSLFEACSLEDTFCNNFPIQVFSRQGDLATVSRLLENPEVDPGANNNSAIRHASTYGHTKVVELLLKHPKVDPTVCQNAATNDAASNGHTEVVEILLKDPRIDPTALGNEAIQFASWYGHRKVVEFLLRHPQVDPTAGHNCALLSAIMTDHTEVVEILLKDPRVDPTLYGNEAIGLASEYGDLKIIEILLKQPLVDPSAQDNESIRKASRFGRFKVVEMLLKDPRVDPSARDNEAIRTAAGARHFTVVELLLKDPRVDPKACFKLPAEKLSPEMIELLNQDSRTFNP